MDQELFIKLAAVTKFFRKENELAFLYQNAENKIEELKSIFSNQKSKHNPITFRYWAISVVLCIYGVAGLFFGLVGGESFAGSLSGILTMAGAVLLLLGVLRISAVKRKRKKYEKKWQKIWEEQYMSQINQEQKKIENIGEQMRNLYDKYGDLITFLPEKYRNLQATAYLFTAVRDGRADTLKEAYNLYEQQLHRWKLEDAAYQAAEIQRMVAAAMDELTAQQSEANAHLNAIEQYEFIKYIHPDSQ